MKKFLTVFIFIFWFVSIASAGELIKGAFGIELGEPLDLNSVQGESIDENDCGVKGGVNLYQRGGVKVYHSG